MAPVWEDFWEVTSGVGAFWHWIFLWLVFEVSVVFVFYHFQVLRWVMDLSPIRSPVPTRETYALAERLFRFGSMTRNLFCA